MRIILLVCSIFLSLHLWAQNEGVSAKKVALVKTAPVKSISVETVSYKEGDVELEGYIARDSKTAKKQPVVLIVHDWMGNGDFSKEKAKKIAELGYVGFAVDIYGKGIRPTSTNEAQALSGEYKNHRDRLRARARAAYDYVRTLPYVDSKKIAVMGYCFGGTTALELARSGAVLSGAISFHGGLSTPTPDDAKKIKAPLLVLHGADDPYVPAEEVAAFKKEMADAKVKMEFVAYPGAVHSFTNPAAGTDNSKGAAYNADADKKSWEEMQKFFKRIL